METPVPGVWTHIPSLVWRGAWRAWMLGFAMVALAACSQGSSPSQGRKLELKPCRLEGLSLQAQCGTYEVFENREAKSGRKLSLRVAVVPALAAQPQPDPLVYLAGGPGQSATRTAEMLLAVERIRRHRDIVLVDQRGTGDSSPLDCELRQKEEGLSALFDEGDVPRRLHACRERWEADVRQYTTPIAMADLDEVRAALGYEKVNLWGVSYGTRAALVYMRQFPERVRTAILDGVAPMGLYLPLYMPRDGQRALELLLSHCEQDAVCEKTFPKLRARTEALLAKLAEAPVRVRVPHPRTGVQEDVVLTQQAFLGALLMQLYSAEGGSLVPLMLDRVTREDWAPFVALSLGGGDTLDRTMSRGLQFAVICAEDAPFFTQEDVEREAKGTWFGALMGLEMMAACEGWPRATLPSGYRDAVVSDVPTLLLSGELDPVTPPAWGEEAKRTLKNGLHVVVPGVGHNALVADCARSLMVEFVAKGSGEGLKPSCGGSLSRPPFFTSFAGPVP
ncbi:alpha/beta hydrolase [Myxococcus llanfairpwllgwyngyllgogerychwyrndrobwllllantysiliogogogochensis]|uniref:Proline iminopeptidase n=2 Tax=Myxococcus llanfairpwllgwyngyllgogerychwyrndrobwllllantysiliogogogochensis TaxID=2590453 RepID=A0A540X4K0_9BACT|nr:alpha/beta hydrolase [Myxococcus llanfairpwllgwyngyllgogerychwyrndrobwllllantysiliogogogochensis]